MAMGPGRVATRWSARRSDGLPSWSPRSENRRARSPRIPLEPSWAMWTPVYPPAPRLTSTGAPRGTLGGREWRSQGRQARVARRGGRELPPPESAGSVPPYPVVRGLRPAEDLSRRGARGRADRAPSRHHGTDDEGPARADGHPAPGAAPAARGAPGATGLRAPGTARASRGADDAIGRAPRRAGTGAGRARRCAVAPRAHRLGLAAPAHAVRDR